jgi:hypothetical protein
MLLHKILEERGIVILEPQSALTVEDFRTLTEEVDAYLEKHPWIHGVVIHTKDFPGWENWQAFTEHLKFVRNHHEEIEKIALVTDATVATLAEKLVKHFVSAEIKHFSYAEYDAALAWF